MNPNESIKINPRFPRENSLLAIGFNSYTFKFRIAMKLEVTSIIIKSDNMIKIFKFDNFLILINSFFLIAIFKIKFDYDRA
jgi:hypothetical protein